LASDAVNPLSSDHRPLQLTTIPSGSTAGEPTSRFCDATYAILRIDAVHKSRQLQQAIPGPR
jgi:hypothetical protein